MIVGVELLSPSYYYLESWLWWPCLLFVMVYMDETL